MAKKTIGLYFFQLLPTNTVVDTPEYKTEVGDIAAAFKASPLSKFTELGHVGGRINLHGKIVEYDGGFLMGTLVNNQMTDIPPVYDNATQTVEPLDLQDTQGLAHPTSFLFDPKANMLMIEVVRNGVGINSFCKYFSHNLSGAPSFDASIVINPRELEKLDKMTIISKFQVKVAKIQSGFVLNSSQRKSIGQIIESADDTNSDKLEYTISSSRKKSLKLNKIKNFVRTFLKISDSEEVKALKVVGSEKNSSSFPLDLIQQKLKDSITVEMERLVAGFYLDSKYKSMIDVYRKHQTMLRASYKIK